MKNHIALIVFTAILAVGANLASAQPKKVELLTAPPPLEPPSLPDDVAEAYQRAVTLFAPGIGANVVGRPLIIPKETGDAKEFAEMEEDLNVMARILEKAASGRDEKGRHAMGITVYNNFIGSPQAPKNLYIEGYGALFFLNVNFPLLQPATKVSEAETKDKTSTEWEEAHRELYRPPGAGFELGVWKAQTSWAPAEEFDADRIQDLKRDLVTALKNATHIRKLKADETVTVVVSSRSPAGEAKLVRKPASGGGAAAGGRAGLAIAKVAAADGQGTRLILRARKTDVDAFQKDKLSFEDFRKKVATIVY